MSGHAPVTGELRELIGRHATEGAGGVVTEPPLCTIPLGRASELMDAIDALHANLEDENARLQGRVVDVASRLADVELEKHTLRNRIVELQESAKIERNGLRNQVLACQRRSRGLDEEVRELRARLSRKVDKVEEQDRIRNQRAELAKLNECIERRNDEIDSLTEENRELSERVVDLEQRNEALTRMLCGTRSDVVARKRDRDYFADVASVACDGVGTLSQAIGDAIGEIDAVIAEIDEVLSELEGSAR